jgi:hypothetical protein
MRVPGKTREVIFRVFVAKVIEQKERVEILCIAKSKCPAQVDAGAFDCRLSFNNTPDWSDRHYSSNGISHTAHRPPEPLA